VDPAPQGSGLQGSAERSNGVERQQIDAATGYQRSSRDAYLQRLGARELVETRGRDVKASDNLFD
jgi:hypothetical protein